MTTTQPLSPAELAAIDAYWRAANYLSVGQIYLQENALLREPLTVAHLKPRLLGHWGTSPGLSLIYAHLNRLIRARDAAMIFVAGPGHGGPAVVANVWLEGTYTEIYPEVTQDARGMRRLLRQFSTPGGIPSHVGPQTPGSIHEGGELGYSLMHAFGAAFDNRDLIVACVVGDGEAETGPLEGSWKGIKFLNPARDGAVLPILHLNGYKIASPTVLGRMRDEELAQLFSGHGYSVHFVVGDDPPRVHQALAATLDRVYADIRAIQGEARAGRSAEVPRWPLIILRTPKGWTGPKVVHGLQVEGTFRSHQVPLANVRTDPGELRLLEEWLRSYRPEELFDGDGRPRAELRALAPTGTRRMSASPHANGGVLLKPLEMPDWHAYTVSVPQPGAVDAEAPRALGKLLRDIFERNAAQQNFRIVSPDELASNRLDDALKATNRTFMEPITPSDDHLARDGRIMEVLSEHNCQGWLEGYLLSGRHGLFPCYEAFATIVDSMLNQHAKWLKTTRELPWRHPIASLNYLLTSHAWRNDHNGYSHQGPGFIDTVMSRKGSITRIYLPPDANCLLSVADHCLRSRGYVNLIVVGKNAQPQWLDPAAAAAHCARGASTWQWASNDGGGAPDVIMACAGDVPTIETLAAVALLRRHLPELRVRVVNVVDLMTLLDHRLHPHGMDDDAFVELFTTDTPVIFAFHGYPRRIHELVHGRPHEERFHVRGYIEEGTTTTPFDMTVLNHMSRFHLAIQAVRRVARLHAQASDIMALCTDKLTAHGEYTRRYFEDMPEVRDWRWPG
jgi:xylulose-5-phosphate/fructose-6-phosphate phosphoketolase